jgi:hypothetical protein
MAPAFGPKPNRCSASAAWTVESGATMYLWTRSITGQLLTVVHRNCFVTMIEDTRALFFAPSAASPRRHAQPRMRGGDRAYSETPIFHTVVRSSALLAAATRRGGGLKSKRQNALRLCDQFGAKARELLIGDGA